jgi:hypothetical protein
MGRFDALTQIEELSEKKPVKKLHTEPIVNELKKSAFFHPKKQRLTPLPEKLDTDTSKKPARIEKKPEIMNSRIHEIPSPIEDTNDKPQKYSTLLYVNSIRKIKLFAANRDIKDYEVIELALTAFFEKNK